jgi:hypothetical protein
MSKRLRSAARAPRKYPAIEARPVMVVAADASLCAELDQAYRLYTAARLAARTADVDGDANVIMTAHRLDAAWGALGHGSRVTLADCRRQLAAWGMLLESDGM